MGFVSDEFKCHKYLTGNYDPKNNASERYYWKFKYVFLNLILTDNFSFDETRTV